MTDGRAAFIGAVGGILIGALVALSGAVVHEVLSGGRRDFVSATHIEADRYEVQVDEDSAEDAKRLLGACLQNASAEPSGSTADTPQARTSRRWNSRAPARQRDSGDGERR